MGKVWQEMPIHGEWYWLIEGENGDSQEVYVFDKNGSKGNVKRFIHVKSGKERMIRYPSKKGVVLKTYIAVAEAIR